MPDFTQSDTILAHLDNLVAGETDPYLRSRYTGFVAVCAATAFEVNVRRKLIEFCTSKHKVFGAYSESVFEKTNARIKIEQLRGEYLKRFGSKYLKRFDKKLETADREAIRTHGGSAKTSYDNLVVWRHGFVHDGELPQNPTYEEARAAYDLSKRVIEVFFETLRR